MRKEDRLQKKKFYFWKEKKFIFCRLNWKVNDRKLRLSKGKEEERMSRNLKVYLELCDNDSRVFILLVLSR